MIEWRGPLPTTNFTHGRSGNPITLFVDHWIGMGTLESAESHFKDPASRVSAHFGIGQDGRIWQWVALEDTAYHAGDWDNNLLSIGIEHEAHPTLPPSVALYKASAWLHRHLAEQYHITLSERTVLEHRSIRPTQCPGTVDIKRIVKEATTVPPIPQQNTPPEYAGQSAAYLQLAVGQVAHCVGIWKYIDGEDRPRDEKFYAHSPGAYYKEIYPLAEDNTTQHLDARPAKFFIVVA